MKKAFSIAGILLFAFLSFRLLFEYGGISMGDTILFRLGGRSLAMGHLPIGKDLSPFWIGALWWLELAAIVAGLATRRAAAAVMAVIAVDSALLIWFYSPALYLLSGYRAADEPLVDTYGFALFAYAGAALSILYGAWLAACAIRRRHGRAD